MQGTVDLANALDDIEFQSVNGDGRAVTSAAADVADLLPPDGKGAPVGQVQDGGRG